MFPYGCDVQFRFEGYDQQNSENALGRETT